MFAVTALKKESKFSRKTEIIELLWIRFEKEQIYMFLDYLPPCIAEIVTIVTRKNTSRFIDQLIDMLII